MPYDGLFRCGANLDLRDINSTNNSYYWCQLEVNSTSLQPSPAGHILFSSTAAKNCSDRHIGNQSDICAHAFDDSNMTLTTSIVASTKPTVSTTTTMPMDTTTPMQTTSPSVETTETTNTTTLCFNLTSDIDPTDICTISTLSAGGFVVLLLICCLLVVLPVCICVRRRRRRRGKMEVGTAKPASSDYKIQSTHTE